MGAGSFRVDTIALPDGTQTQVGIFTVVAVADYSLEGQVDEFQWQLKMNDLNAGIFQASYGRIVVEVFLSSDSWGLAQAELILHQNPNSPAYATYGKFGRFGEAVHLFSWPASSRHTLVHEFGHHAWGLGDEYTAPLLSDQIDSASPSPDNTIIPIDNPQNSAADVAGSHAVLKFGINIERRIVTGYDPIGGTVTVDAPFSADPITAKGGIVWFQRAAACAASVSDRFCIMDSFPASGNTPKFDFCISAVHDPDGDTLHTARYPGEACWDVMVRIMSDRWGFPLTAPQSLSIFNSPVPEVAIFALEKEARVALAMDRSGSMGTDGKIQGARYGVEFWLRSLAHTEADCLSLLWYNAGITLQLELDQYTDAQAIDDAITVMNNDVPPAGWTNIRDALYRAREEIQSRDGRAAIQAVILLTDGIHNRPEGTDAREVIPSFQADGIQIICVGLGGPDNIDYDVLEALADDTGGAVIRVEGGGIPSIERGLADAEAVLRLGKVQEGDLNLAPLPREVLAIGQKEHPTLAKLMAALKFDSVKSMLKNPPPGVAVTSFFVEEGAQAAKFSAFYWRGQSLWLYLIDPDGHPVDVESSGNTLIRPAAPFISVQVKAPKSGRWWAVISGAAGIHPIPVLYLGMVANRRVVVSGGCRRQIENAGDAVDFWAAATFGDRLSGLHVDVRITKPNGATHLIQLSDDDPSDPGSGDYRGLFVADLPGAYHYTMRIRSTTDLQAAGGMHRLAHANPKTHDRVSLQTNAKAFTRVLSGYFDVGKRPTPRDIDSLKEQLRWPIQPRKNKLVRIALGRPDEKAAL